MDEPSREERNKSIDDTIKMLRSIGDDTLFDLSNLTDRVSTGNPRLYKSERAEIAKTAQGLTHFISGCLIMVDDLQRLRLMSQQRDDQVYRHHEVMDRIVDLAIDLIRHNHPDEALDLLVKVRRGPGD